MVFYHEEHEGREDAKNIAYPMHPPSLVDSVRESMEQHGNKKMNFLGGQTERMML